MKASSQPAFFEIQNRPYSLSVTRATATAVMVEITAITASPEAWPESMPATQWLVQLVVLI